MTPRKEFDFTMMSTFCNCRKKYDYRMNKGLVGKSRAMAPEFGGAIHKALDVMYQGKMRSGDFLLAEGIQVFKESFKEDLVLDDKRTHRMGEWILGNYATTYHNEPFDVVAIEQDFTLPLPNGNNLIGRIDKILSWDGLYWVMDHKTTSQLGASYGQSLAPNGQFTGYLWAARQLGFPKCVGVIVDAILVAKGLLQASSRARMTPLARFDSYTSDDQIAEWLETVIKIQKDIKHQEEHDVWPQDGMFNGMCTYYGQCAYRKLCSEERGLRDKIIPMDYDVSFWDPRSKGDD